VNKAAIRSIIDEKPLKVLQKLSMRVSFIDFCTRLNYNTDVGKAAGHLHGSIIYCNCLS
jgi:hypothetical protein